ncbi:hypothetical protein FJU30_05670 [Affinibrenneria salicis]|uniref:Uncharacterized protein n=1 Tax=Affinibrenneria salicis TaxID=2590031 RepID=A0A5J5G413_9GAMM|nr:hypothetical protein [Affinibrenneria salicis]KAA9001779.1 hypothetical protein FJU30_05670 [Affinibrenneria salicis]
MSKVIRHAIPPTANGNAAGDGPSGPTAARSLSSRALTPLDTTNPVRKRSSMKQDTVLKAVSTIAGQDQISLKAGSAPYPILPDQILQKTVELHPVDNIQHEGPVYGIDNPNANTHSHHISRHMREWIQHET